MMYFFGLSRMYRPEFDISSGSRCYLLSGKDLEMLNSAIVSLERVGKNTSLMRVHPVRIP
jgi:hypothetical protein